MDFCCEKMSQEALELMSDEKEKNYMVSYNRRWRRYLMSHFYHERGKDIADEIFYCPWCGSKLPKELSDEWFEVLEQEYGIVSPQNHDRKKVPPEFKTDEWWKKRGL